MKRITSLILATLLLIGFAAGCGKEKNRVLYKDVKLSKYVELGDYKGIKVDTSSDKHKEYVDTVIKEEIANKDLYVRKTEGTVADGDTVNIDYTGKKDGVTFDGGTDTGYDLVIGSDSFIDGFEDGLIGVEIGSTVDLNLTFPDNYGSTELAGKAVVFTVKVNYVKTDEERKPEDYYKELGFKTYEEYEADVDKRAAKTYLLDTVVENSKVKDYPKDDLEYISEHLHELMENNIKSQTGVDLNTYLGYIGQTMEDFEKDLVENQVKPMMDNQLVLYALLDNEGIEVSAKDVDKKVAETVKEYGDMSITADVLKEYYGEYYFETLAVSEKAINFIYDNAKIS